MRLPSTPSTLIRLAIGDFRKCLKSRKYKIDMKKWHKPNRHCSVCVAGAVMAGTLNRTPDHEFHPDDFSRTISDKLCALDSFRLGSLKYFIENTTTRTLSRKQLHAIDKLEWGIACDLSTAQMNHDWRTFIRLSLKVADRLEEIRL